VRYAGAYKREKKRMQNVGGPKARSDCTKRRVKKRLLSQKATRVSMEVNLNENIRRC